MRELVAPPSAASPGEEGGGEHRAGTWPSEDFFLLTVAHETDASRFGLLVEDVDATHRRALDAGATEVNAPVDAPWKPRWSCVTDPSGNNIDLYQA